MRVVLGFLLFIAVLASTPQVYAQQSVTPPKPTIPMYLIHYSGTASDFDQVTYFEHEGIRCYRTERYDFYRRVATGGISCVRK